MSFRRMPSTRVAPGKDSNHEVVKGTEFRQGLAHHDKGESCKTCGPHICPGFQLHFWRKVCQHCRCPESEHMSAQVMENMETETRRTLNGLFLTENYDDMTNLKEVGRLNIPGATFEGSHSLTGGNYNPSSRGSTAGIASPGRRVSNAGVSNAGVSNAGVSNAGVSNTGVPTSGAPSPVAGSGRSSGSGGPGDLIPTSNSGHTLGFGSGGRRRSVMMDNCEGFRKIKTGQTKNLVAKFMENIPETEKKQAATYRQKQLLHQLPAHDIDGKACKTLMTDDEKQEMEEFRQHRQQHALGQGLIYTIGQKRDAEDESKDTDGLWDCEECKSQMGKGETAIFTEKTGPERCWHGKCFVCFTCKELLVDLIYFHKDDHVYCGRHHAELVKPRCKACDELIFTGEYTHAEDADWHIVHFCCWKCDELLGGKRYISREGHPFCLSCFDKEFGKKCSTCNKPIAADESHLTHKDMTWHGNDECFTCQTCKVSLVGKPFLPRLDRIFCSRNCYKKYKEEHVTQ